MLLISEHIYFYQKNIQIVFSLFLKPGMITYYSTKYNITIQKNIEEQNKKESKIDGKLISSNQ